jgi:hypothetical protein
MTWLSIALEWGTHKTATCADAAADDHEQVQQDPAKIHGVENFVCHVRFDDMQRGPFFHLSK